MFIILLIAQVFPASKLYIGIDLSKYATIVRNKTVKDATLEITYPKKWYIYSGPKVEEIDYSKPLLSGSGPGNYSLSVPKTRIYFQLVTNEGKSIISERHLPIEKGFNFRDLGGYRTLEGRYVKWGKIIRTDEILNLNSSDVSYLNSIPIKTVIDFRTDSESSSSPEYRFSDFYERLGINAGDLTSLMYRACPYMINSDQPADLTVTEQDIVNEMISLNKQFINDDNIIDQFRKFFEYVQNPSKLPIAYHCTAGKDRTGISSFMILTSLGVSQDVAFEDYLLSNVYLEPKYRQLKTNCPVLSPALGVAREFIQAAIDEANEKYGSLENFFTRMVGVNITLMKELFLD